MSPTIYVDIDSKYTHNPIARVLKVVAFGAEPVEQLVDGDVEANIAITNSVETALRMVKETERTSIVLAHFGQESEEAQSFASRYPDRVTAVPFVSSGDGEMEIVPFLLKLIADKTEEV